MDAEETAKALNSIKENFKVIRTYCNDIQIIQHDKHIFNYAENIKNIADDEIIKIHKNLSNLEIKGVL